MLADCDSRNTQQIANLAFRLALEKVQFDNLALTDSQTLRHKLANDWHQLGDQLIPLHTRLRFLLRLVIQRRFGGKAGQGFLVEADLPEYGIEDRPLPLERLALVIAPVQSGSSFPPTWLNTKKAAHKST